MSLISDSSGEIRPIQWGDFKDRSAVPEPFRPEEFAGLDSLKASLEKKEQARRVLTSQNTDDWFTPLHVIAWVKAILGGIDLDPASCAAANEVVGADNYFTLTAMTDGLVEKWGADTVFVNPPFSDTPKWLAKMSSEYAAGHFREGILLVNTATGYLWFERLWRERTVCCLEKRLHFIPAHGKSAGAAKKGQTLAYFGADDTAFRRILTPHGRVFSP